METQTVNYPQITRAFMRAVLNNADGNVILACQALKVINPNFPADFFIECEGVYESVIDSNTLLYGFSEDENEELDKGQVIDENTDIAKLALILDQQGLIDSFMDYFNEYAIAYKEACSARVDEDLEENDTEDCYCCAKSNKQENYSEDDDEDLEEDNDKDLEEDDEECECCENVHYIPMLDEQPLSYNERQMIRIMRSKNLPTVIQVAHDTDEIESLKNFSGMYMPSVDEMTLDEKEILMIRTMRLLNQQ
jgi:hypothetical protein